ncbi:MAG: energy transducer TonB [Nitrospinae bacterium]|nr:energy transducer TonB [Nitrospinota bacterium]
MPNENGRDLLFLALSLSIALHAAGFLGMYTYGTYFGGKPRLTFKQDSYVVHLIDPGPIAGEPTLGKSSVVDAVPQSAPAVKKVSPVEKKLLPITKDAGGEIKKVTLVKKSVNQKMADTGAIPSRLKQKQALPEAKQSESVAKEVREKKGGGIIHLKDFPYEWHIRMMEGKIFTNWDTLSFNYFTDRPIKVTIYYKINREGKITHIEIEQSSLNNNIDRSALEAVQKSAPFPPLPPGYKEETLDVHFGFTLAPGR